MNLWLFGKIFTQRWTRAAREQSPLAPPPLHAAPPAMKASALVMLLAATCCLAKVPCPALPLARLALYPAPYTRLLHAAQEAPD